VSGHASPLVGEIIGTLRKQKEASSGRFVLETARLDAFFVNLWEPEGSGD
jgi:hypothetical protein